MDKTNGATSEGPLVGFQSDTYLVSCSTDSRSTHPPNTQDAAPRGTGGHRESPQVYDAWAVVVPALVFVSCNDSTNETPIAPDAAPATQDASDLAGEIRKADLKADLGVATTTSVPRAIPFVFVGTAAECTPSPAGSRIVTAAWLRGMGLPDNGGANSGSPNNARQGLLLSKNGPTANCSSSGARITNVRGLVVESDFALGFDYRNGGHCGAGAPRFNVDTDMGFFFVGCANAPQSPTPQDLAEWTRTRSLLTTCGAECFNVTLGIPGPVPAGAKIKSISILFDEGTDNPILPNDPAGIGLAVIDNIVIGGHTIRRP